jgi:hypothetical protein
MMISDFFSLKNTDKSDCRDVPVVTLAEEHCHDIDQALLRIYEQHKGLPFVRV